MSALRSETLFTVDPLKTKYIDPFSLIERVVAEVAPLRRASVADTTSVILGAVISSATAEYVKAIPGVFALSIRFAPEAVAVTPEEVTTDASDEAIDTSVSAPLLRYSYGVPLMVTRNVQPEITSFAMTDTLCATAGTLRAIVEAV